MNPRLPPRALPALLAAVSLLAAGCGSSSSSPTSGGSAATSGTAGTSGTATPPTASGASTSPGPSTTPAPAPGLAAAETPSPAAFPPAGGRSLTELGRLGHAGTQLGAATGTFTPGTDRLAFALTTQQGSFVYAPTALYLARTPNSPATGPYLAPADPMTVEPAYRSRQNTGPGGIQAIYATNLPLPRPGTYLVLALTRTPSGMLASGGEVAVAAHSPIPQVGQRPPAIQTDTPAGVHGDTSLLTTRIPPDDMHTVSFDRVLGRQPVALLFSTPQLCTSRVCGPVTDELVQLENRYRGRIAFIHEEVYVANDPRKGLRPQMHAFHLETEPWLFTIDRQGRIAARLEGTFGLNEVQAALEAALR